MVFPPLGPLFVGYHSWAFGSTGVAGAKGGVLGVGWASDVLRAMFGEDMAIWRVSAPKKEQNRLLERKRGWLVLLLPSPLSHEFPDDV